MNYGYQTEDIKSEDYIFGSGEIYAPILQADGQWDAFLPQDEVQNLNGIEPYACVTFCTLNCIETLLRRLFTQVENYSDRYTAYVTGTFKNKGNSPQTVAEYIRHNGAAFEKDWPFSTDITSFDQFYETPPSYLAAFAENFLDQFEFKHDYVPNNPTSFKAALKYSPLGVSVSAWYMDNGLYVDKGIPNNHFCMIYGYLDGEHWKVFDSYDNTHKQLAWNFEFEVAKRYAILRTEQSYQQLQGWKIALQKALAFLKNLIH